MAWNDLTNPEAWKLALANLLRKGEDVGTYISEAPEKAGKAIVEAGQRQSALMNKAFDPTGKTLIRDPQAANQAAMNLLEGPLGFMPAGITAWHGSPHTFEKFDMSKVGTGEGAQSYGHGMYFAEARPVAEEYKDFLGKKITVGGTPIYEANKRIGKTGDSLVDDMIVANLGDIDKAIKMAKEGYQDIISKNPEGGKDFFNAWKKLEQYKNAGQVNTQSTGNLYKVDIPDEHIPMMLDWDKPLYEQNKEILNKIPESWFSNAEMYGNKGKALYDWLIDLTNSQEKASKMLNDVGIKGITYLDQGSRGAGKGTSNFVVFDPTDVKILERNNQPLTRKEILEEGFSKVNQPRKGTTKVDVPISMIEHGESALPGGRLTFPTAKETIKGYASKETPFPPIDLMGDASSKVPFMVVDGSHRLEAAKLRGDKTIPAYLDAEDLTLLNSLLKK